MTQFKNPGCFGSYTTFDSKKEPCKSCAVIKECANRGIYNIVEIEKSMDTVLSKANHAQFFNMKEGEVTDEVIKADFKAAVLEKYRSYEEAYVAAEAGDLLRVRYSGLAQIAKDIREYGFYRETDNDRVKDVIVRVLARNGVLIRRKDKYVRDL